MKKSFYFVLALTAGLFASCSSDEVVSAPQANLNDSQKAPIELKLGSLGNVTRGTGTVGGLNGAADNVWAGQKFNVYMFDKGTLTLAQDELGNDIYDNQEFASPNVLAGVSADASAKVIAAAGTDYGTGNVQDPNPDGLTLTEVNGYFPQGGNFDFWAYRLDGAQGANVPALNAAGDAMTVNFTIDGSQDIMVAKATPTQNLNAADATHQEAYYTVGGNEIPEPQVYSAYAARRGLQPHLAFQHLLTRLAFTVKSTKGLSQQYADATDDATSGAVNPSAVRVTEIKVNAIADGELVVAYTGAAPANIITFDGNAAPVDLFLQQRAREVAAPAELAWSQDLTTLGMVGEDAIYDYANSADVHEATTNALEVYQYNDINHMGADGLPDPTTNPVSTLGAAIAAQWPHIYAYQVENATTYGNPDIAAGLVALQPVTPRWDMKDAGTDAQHPIEGLAYKTPVGESLLLGPAASYLITITMEQDVPELTQVISISYYDAHNQQRYYFATEAARDVFKGLYEAWEATGFAAAGDPDADAYFAAAAAASTEEIKVVLKKSTKTTSKQLTVKGPATTSLGVTTYKEFEPNKTYNISITLNGLEDVESNTELSGFEDGGEVDIEN